MIIKKTKLSLFPVLMAAALSGLRPARCAIINGGFETGTFAGWSRVGDTSIVTSAFGSGPVVGTYEALVQGGGQGTTVPNLETFIGVPGGSLNSLGNGIVHGGSAIQQIFAGTAGQILDFNWNFITDETPPSIFNDFAFWSLNSLSTLATANQTGLIPFDGLLQTGFKETSFVLPNTGAYTLTLGVANVSDTGGLPQLLVDDVTVTSIPEPSYGPAVLIILGAVLGIKVIARSTPAGR